MSVLKKIFHRISNMFRRSTARSRYDYVLGFGTTKVTSHGRITVSARPKIAFRPERIVIPSDVARHLLVAGIKIDNNEQLSSTCPVPAVLFTEKAFSVRLRMDVATPSDSVSVTVDNTSDVEQDFQCGLCGPVA